MYENQNKSITDTEHHEHNEHIEIFENHTINSNNYSHQSQCVIIKNNVLLIINTNKTRNKYENL